MRSATSRNLQPERCYAKKSMDNSKSKARAKIDMRVAGFLGIASLLLYCSAIGAATGCARKYGHNVDCGAYEWLAAVFYFGPLTLIVAVAALALWRAWPLCWLAHWLAIASIIALPFFEYALL